MSLNDRAPRIFALVPCAGTGSRAGGAGPKQYVPLAGQPLVAHTLAALRRVGRIDATLVVLAPGDVEFEARLPRAADARLWLAKAGGATRAVTVANGLAGLRARGAQPHDWVLVHDAARCLIRPEWVERLIDACVDDEVGGLLALPLADTLKNESPGAAGRCSGTLDRAGKWAAQTPQMFRLGRLQQALAAAQAASVAVTDEASAVEALGFCPKLVPGEFENFKVTFPGDFALAGRLLLAGAAEPLQNQPSVCKDSDHHRQNTEKGAAMTATLRIGEGWDCHQLVSGRPLVLGGVTIAHSHGLAGHSDADALLHAITDAILGAAALGDIGRHFPDTAAEFKGADSHALLAEAARRVRAAGWQVANVDATIIAQAPKMAPHIPAMVARIAAALGVAAAAVNVKAKTAENLGPVGEGRSIEARAVCLLGRA